MANTDVVRTEQAERNLVVAALSGARPYSCQYQHDRLVIFKVRGKDPVQVAIGTSWPKVMADLAVELTYRTTDVRLAATYLALSKRKKAPFEGEFIPLDMDTWFPDVLNF